MPIGKEWANEIKSHLEKASLMFVIISDLSVERKWLYFESGSAYIKGISVIPICVNGYKVSKLSPPLSFFHGIELPNERDEKKLLEVLAKEVELYIPNPPYKLELISRDTLVEEIESTKKGLPDKIEHDSNVLTKRNSIRIANEIKKDITDTLNELLFVVNLHSMSGNYSDVEFFPKVIEKAFSTNKLVSKTGLKEILKKLEDSLSNYKSETGKMDWSIRYDKVRVMINSIIEQFPPKQECIERIINYPVDAWLPYLVYKYFVGYSFPQMSWFINDTKELIIDKDNGKRILPVIEDIILKESPNESDYKKGITVARSILRKDFNAWFVDVKGVSYEAEQKSFKEQQIAEKEMRIKDQQFELEREKVYLERRKLDKENNEMKK